MQYYILFIYMHSFLIQLIFKCKNLHRTLKQVTVNLVWPNCDCFLIRYEYHLSISLIFLFIKPAVEFDCEYENYKNVRGESGPKL